MSQTQEERTYSADEIAERLTGPLADWTFKDGQIRRLYKTVKWPETLLLANAVAYLAERADHHPDLLASYASLEVRLSTHSAGGITDKDFALAERIEALIR
jgi:4a-hydroxytetrahydrobiopterin dehydratase